MAKIRVAVFPAAGLGTRFLPATKAQPKEMLPLVDRPLIQYVVEEARDAGIERIVIVTGRGKNAIEDHFDTSFELERMLEDRGKNGLLEQVREVSEIMPVSYVRQKQALGLGHAVLQARDLVGDQPFAVMLGDDIVDAAEPCIGQMMRVFERRGNPVIALQEVPRAETRQYGIVAGEKVGGPRRPDHRHGREAQAEEAPSNLAIIGRYLLPPEIFDDPRRDALRRGRRDPAHERPEDAALAAARSTATSSRASATTPATSSGSSRRRSSSR